MLQAISVLPEKTLYFHWNRSTLLNISYSVTAGIQRVFLWTNRKKQRQKTSYLLLYSAQVKHVKLLQTSLHVIFCAVITILPRIITQTTFVLTKNTCIFHTFFNKVCCLWILHNWLTAVSDSPLPVILLSEDSGVQNWEFVVLRNAILFSTLIADTDCPLPRLFNQTKIDIITSKIYHNLPPNETLGKDRSCMSQNLWSLLI